MQKEALVDISSIEEAYLKYFTFLNYFDSKLPCLYLSFRI